MPSKQGSQPLTVVAAVVSPRVFFARGRRRLPAPTRLRLDLTVVGWTLFGAGLPGTVPQLFSVAGHSDPAAAATAVSRVACLGYCGMLAARP